MENTNTRVQDTVEFFRDRLPFSSDSLVVIPSYWEERERDLVRLVTVRWEVVCGGGGRGGGGRRGGACGDGGGGPVGQSDSSLQQQQQQQQDQQVYRDRAKERRLKYGEDDEMQKRAAKNKVSSLNSRVFSVNSK